MTDRKNSKKNVLIIGAGSGTTTAHMMEHMSDVCNVTLVEKTKRLGGHINTLKYSKKELLEIAELVNKLIDEIKRCGDDWDSIERLLKENKVDIELIDEIKRCDNDWNSIEKLLKKKYFDTELIHEINQYGDDWVFIAEGGAEFIGPPESYPLVHKHFKALNVTLDKFAMSSHIHHLSEDKFPGFFNRMLGKSMMLPPVYWIDSKGKTKKNKSSEDEYTKAQRRDIQPEMKVALESLIKDWPDLLRLQHLLCRLRNDIDDIDNGLYRRDKKPPSLQSYLEEHFKKNGSCCSSDNNHFIDNVVYPLIAASWGVSIEEAKKKRAHYAFNYLSLGMSWYDARDGLSTYIENMTKQWQHADVRTGCEVSKLERVEGSESLQYKALLANGEYLREKNADNSEGAVKIFDDVVISTPAYATKDILENLPEMKDLREKLERVRYYDTKVVFHLDRRFETKTQAVVHTRVLPNGAAANTAQKDWKGPILKTWIMEGHMKPEPTKVLDTKYYRHPYMDEHYYEAQQALRAMQNKYGLHFGGILAGLGDSHEDALTVAMQNAERLSNKYECLNDNKRLEPYLEKGKIPEHNKQLSSELQQASVNAEENESPKSCCSW